MFNKDYIDFNKLGNLSEIDNGVEMSSKVIKLSEEVGELSQAFLKYIGSKNVSASAGENTKENMLEETLDSIIVAMDIVNALGFEDIEVKNMFNKKLSKWDAKTLKY